MKNNKRLNELILNPPSGFRVVPSPRMYIDAGNHPTSRENYECIFISEILSKLNPQKVLDIGSYRQFVIGLMARFQVTILDIRKITDPILNNETRIITDAKNIPEKDNEFDVVISTCALEHFGLGRYGDEFDLQADRRAMKEILRVLKPKGSLLFTTTITGGSPAICFNAHRIYNYKMIKEFSSGFFIKQEQIYNNYGKCFLPVEEADKTNDNYEFYCGYWEKI